MFPVDAIRGSDGTYPGSPACLCIVPVQELNSTVKFGCCWVRLSGSQHGPRQSDACGHGFDSRSGHFSQILRSTREYLSIEHYISEVNLVIVYVFMSVIIVYTITMLYMYMWLSFKALPIVLNKACVYIIIHQYWYTYMYM